MLIFLLTIYIVILLGIAWWIARTEQAEDFLIAGRNRPAWQLLLSKFSAAVGATWFITYTAYAYEYGLGVYGAIFGFVVAYIVFALWAAPKIHALSQKTQCYTQGDLVAAQTGSVTAKHWTNRFSALTQGVILVVGIIGGAKVMEHTGLLSYEVALLTSAAVVLLYILIAGYKAVILTDAVQGAVIVGLLGLVAYALFADHSFRAVIDAQTQQMSIGTIISFVVYGLLSVFGKTDRYQLCLAARDVRALKRGMLWAILPIVIVASLLMFIGIAVFLMTPGLDPDIAFLHALTAQLPTALLPFGILLFFAGLMSSADTSIYAISSHLTLRDTRPDAIKRIRKHTVLVVAVAVIIGLIYRDIVGLTLIAAALAVTLAVPMLYILFGKKHPSRFIGSLFGGFTGLVIGIFLVGVEPTLTLTALVGALLGLLYTKESRVIPTD